MTDQKPAKDSTSSDIFKPRARLMLLLGDQLIRDSGIAVFELVKNAYDADATNCIITLHNVIGENQDAKIAVEDDGEGMDIDTVRNIWLEPGTEHRKEQRLEGKRTPKFKRLPLGEKGVGRFAVHKLGRKIRVITRSKGCKEIVIDVDWNSFKKARYLSDVGVKVTERDPIHFRDKATGTLIRISDLRDLPWNRRRVRQLHRAVASICSPFESPDEFSALLEIKPKSNMLDGLMTPEEVFKYALFEFEATISRGELDYSYKFKPGRQLRGLDGREARHMLPVKCNRYDEPGKKATLKDVDLDRHNIGDVELNFRIFDLAPTVLKMIAKDISGLKSYLRANGGVRVYRDGVRVYDFGEEGNDWLDLGGKRVNVPAKRIGNNQIIGAVSLSLESSSSLVEKTNREGFVENEAYEDFRAAVEFAVQQAQLERNIDKDRLRKLYTRGKMKEPVLADLTDLRIEIMKRPEKVQSELLPYVDRIEKQYRDVQDRLLVTASAGLNLASVMHEVEKAIENLYSAIKHNADHSKLIGLASRLSDMVDGFNWLTKKSGSAKTSASKLVEQTIFNSEHRFDAHGVKVENGLMLDDPDFEVRCSRRLVLGSVMNVVDNAIYWLDVKANRAKRLYIGTSYEVNGLPGIVIADNGPGFVDPPEYLTQPFYSRKPDGIGLGLHIADMVMKSDDGRLLFPGFDDLTLPAEYRNGAIVFLEFGGQNGRLETS